MEGRGGPILLPIAIAHAEDTVVVEATRARAETATASVTVLDLGEAVGPAEDVASVLDSASGTVVRRLGGLGDFSSLRLRGSTDRQVEIFLDGIPLNPDGGEAVDLAELPASAFDRVEIWRGNAPPELASVAMGGVVNLVTPGADLRPRLAAAGGSHGTWSMSGVAGPGVELGPGRLDSFVALDAFHTDGDWAYFDDQGTEFNLADDRTPTRENNDISRAHAIGRLRWTGAKAQLALLDRWSASDRGYPGPISDPAAEARGSVGENLVAARLDAWPARPVHLAARAWWLARAEELDDQAAELGTGAQLYTRSRDAWGAQADLGLAPWAWLDGGLSLRWRQDREQVEDLLLDATGAEHRRDVLSGALSATLRAFDDRVELGPVLHLQWIGPRSASGGEALDVDNKEDDGAPAEAFVLPRVGARLSPWPWIALRGNLGLYARPPGFDELYGDGGSVQGNVGLLAESGFALDLGLRVQSPTWRRSSVALDLAYARNESENLIAWVQNSQATIRAENIGRAYVRSVEGALTVEAFGFLRSQSNLSWLLSRNLEEDRAYANNELPGLPALELAQSTSLHWEEKVELRHSWSWTSLTWLDAANTTWTAPRDLHGLALRVQPSPALPSLELQILNLFDVRGEAVDRDPLSDEDDALVVKPLVDFAGYPLPGRSFMLGASWSPPPRKVP